MSNLTRYTVSVPDGAGFTLQYYGNDNPAPKAAYVYPSHIHDCMEVYLLREGDVSFLVEGRLYHLRPGDAVVSKPNELHHCIHHENTPHRHYCFWFYPQSAFLFSRFLSYTPGAGNLISPTDHAVRARILSVAAELLRLSREGGSAVTQYARAVELLALWQENLAPAAAEETLPPRLGDILADIEQNLPNIRRLDYFTEKYYLSRATLGRLFRTYLHTAPHAYLENKRLALARALMRRGAGVTEACMEAGFGDLSDFIRLFRRRFGITPAAYRRAGDDAIEIAPNIYKAETAKP